MVRTVLPFLSRNRHGCVLLVAAVLLVSVCHPAFPFTKLEGEYQLMIDARKSDRDFPWDFDFNNNDTWTGAQLRVFSVPFKNTEAFVKFEADWNPGGNNTDRPVFQYRESHLRFKWDRGADIYVFQRQDRFWVERHLIDVIRSGDVTDGGNAQGVRFDWEGGSGTKLTYILSDFTGQSTPEAGAEPGRPIDTDDAHILRFRRQFLGDRLRLGWTYNRRVEIDEQQPGLRPFQEVWAYDLRYRLGSTDILFEYADSRSSSTPDHEEGKLDLGNFSPRRPDYWLPEDAVLRGEIRAIRLGNAMTGYYNIVPTFWYYGPGFVNRLGDGKKDEQGIWINTWYLVPQRAITVSLNYLALEERVFDKRRTKEFYGEVYTEYVNGFTTKIIYSDREEKNLNVPGIEEVTDFRSLFAEIQVESKLAWMRVQGKIKDLGTPRRKELASLESAVNLTDKLKVYGRYAFGNDPARLRKGLFTQLQYRPRGNMEIFLEYGPNWIGDTPNPVDDGDLAGGGDQRDLIKLIVKGNF